MNATKSLQIPVRLAPPVLKHNISEADWPEPSHVVADRQQRIRVDAGRQAESGLRFRLELQVQRRQSRAEPERSCRRYTALQADLVY